MWCHKSGDHKYTKFRLVVSPPCACLIPSVWRWRDRSLSISIVFLLAEIKGGSPTLNELLRLSRTISNKWKDLGRWLNFDEAQITEHDNYNDTFSEKAYQLLMAWKQREALAATYLVLYKALSEVERRDLAEEFCCQWKRYFCTDQFPNSLPENQETIKGTERASPICTLFHK